MFKNRLRYQKPLFVSPKSRSPKKSRWIWRGLAIIWSAFKRTSMAIGFAVLFSFTISAILLSSISVEPPKRVELPEKFVLYMPMKHGLREVKGQASLTSPFADGGLTVQDYIEVLDKATADERVQSLVVRLEGLVSGKVAIQEFQQGLQRFRDAGKKAYIYAPSYLEAGGFDAYYFASGFDEIWMQPMGLVSITGMGGESPYVRSLMEKWGVEPQFFQRKEYKGVFEMFQRDSMSDPGRLAMTQLIEDVSGVVVKDIAAHRGLEENAVKGLIDKGLFIGSDAQEFGLISHAAYVDELSDLLKIELTGDKDSEETVFVSVGGYRADVFKGPAPEEELAQMLEGWVQKDLGIEDEEKAVDESGARVALVRVNGAIVSSAEGAGGLTESMAAANKISEAIWAAKDDKSIKTLVLRVNSPGGSPTASETILRAIKEFQETEGRTVVVSMGSVAASGGYWVASSADKIFAMPATITGSIGVAGGKVSLEGLWRQLGVNWDGVSWGKNNDLWSLNKPFDAAEKERIDMMLDTVYDEFVKRVSEGRKMSYEEAEKVARGRVWSGVRAKEVGLVDELGSLNDALDFVAKERGFEGRQDLEVVVLPRPKNSFEQFLELLSDGSVIFEHMSVAARAFSVLVPEQVRGWFAVQSTSPVQVYESAAAL